jgi:RHH-type rel operon transcriptional repressor/antitoxin RelB
MASNTITIRVPADLKKRIERLARRTHRSKSDLGAEALHDFVDWNEEMLARIEEGLSATDGGDFASPEDVNATFAQLKRRYSSKSKAK